MGICRSPTYWNWSMSTTHPKETCTYQIFAPEEEWQFFEKGNLKKTCSARVCVTCQHFNCSSDKHCRTLPFCHVHRRLIPHGDHLVSTCHLWMRQREREIGWYLEVSCDSDQINLPVRGPMSSLTYIWPYQLYWLSIFFALVFSISLALSICIFSQSRIF